MSKLLHKAIGLGGQGSQGQAAYDAYTQVCLAALRRAGCLEAWPLAAGAARSLRLPPLPRSLTRLPLPPAPRAQHFKEAPVHVLRDMLELKSDR